MATQVHPPLPSHTPWISPTDRELLLAGLEPCLSLLAASPILMAPVLEALTLAATRSEVKGVRNMPSVEKAAQIVAGARLVSATCRRQELKEGALEVQEAIDGALQALVAAASRLGPAAAGNFKADRACRQVSMQVDTLFGRVS